MVYKKPIFKYVFWTFFLLFTISHNFSQTTIKGKIFDSQTNEDLIGATIKIVNSGFGCVTDFNGEFILKTNLKLPLTLEVSYIGYEEQSVNLNENVYLKIYLKSKDLQLKAVEVLGGISKKLKESPLSIESMDINDIKKRLPQRYPFLLVDRVVEMDLGKRILAYKNITANEEVFNGHFPNTPIFPGVMIIEDMAKAAGVLGFVTADKYADDNVLYLFAGVDGVRFKRQVIPGDRLMLEAKVDSVKRTTWRFKCRATVDDELACEATILCALKMV